MDGKEKKAGLRLAKTLNKAIDAMEDFVLACDEDEIFLNDSRVRLKADMNEYMEFLFKRYDR